MDEARWLTLTSRLFDRFLALYGTDQLERMWRGQDMDAVKLIWADSLCKFHPNTIGAAVRDLEATGKAYPPTLPEFVSACRVAALQAKQVGNPLPPERHLEPPKVSPEEVAEARRQLAELVAKMTAKP